MLSFPDGESGLVRYHVGGAWNVAGRAGRYRASLILVRKRTCPQLNSAELMLRNTSSLVPIREIQAAGLNVLKSISRSWAALANQLEGLEVIERSEGK